MDSTIDRILKLVEKSGETDKTILLKSEISKSSLTEWRKGKAKPSTDAIIKLANYFNVSTDFLLLGKEKTLDLSSEEKEWLKLLHQLTESERLECIGYLKGFINGRHQPDREIKKVVGK